MSTITEVTVL